MVAGADFGGGLHVSHDHGTTWTSHYPFGIHSGVGDLAISEDGNRLLGIWGSRAYVSDDAGQNWALVGPAVICRGVAMSESGLRLAIASSPGFIHVSKDGGATWSATGDGANWHEVACSSDGTRLIAAQYSGALAVSPDGGTSWTTRDIFRKWTAVVSSADGHKLAACARDDLIWLSDDAGLNWRSTGQSDSWEDIVCSPDGEFLAAVAEDGRVYTSSDRGRTWLPRATERKWTALALSANTLELWAADFFGHVLLSVPQASSLRFAPAANQSGGPGESFTFQVADSGPDGANLDPTPNTFTLHVTPADDPPAVAAPVPDAFAAIGEALGLAVPPDSFTDPDPGTTLTFAASLDNGGPLPPWLSFNPVNLTFTGTPTTADRGSFTVRLAATDQTGRSVADDFQVQVAGRPRGTGTRVSLIEEATYTFSGADFGFTDPLDTPADIMTRVRLTSLPASGTLYLNGNPVARGDFVPMLPTPGVDWSQRSASAGSVLAASDDANHLLAVRPNASHPSVFRSADGGRTWMPVADFGISLPRPTAAAASADGTRWVVASADGSQIYTSADSGQTWTARESIRRWHALACSADGSRILAVDHGENGGFPYVSTDFGVTWNAGQGAGWWIADRWTAAASSADGTKMVIASRDPGPIPYGLILTSDDGGINWSLRSPRAHWTCLTSSDDGTYLAAASTGGLFLSDDSGETWRTTLADADLTSVSSSATGLVLAATARNGRILVSTDRGATWAPAGPTANWLNVVSSADGRNLLAAGSLGLYASIPSVPPLTYAPPANGAGTPYTSMTYQVEDSGPDGLNLDPLPRGLNIEVLNLNDPPIAANPLPPLIVPAGGAVDYVVPFTSFLDPDPGEILSFTMALRSGEPWPAWLSFHPASRRLSATAGSAIPGHYQIIVTARDQGTPPREAHNLLEIRILSHPPTGSNLTVTLMEDTPRRFTASDFGFSDALDQPPQPFRRIWLAAAPLAGRLTIDGIPLSTGEYVSMVPEPLMVWPPSATVQSWKDVAVSPDGTRLAAVWGDQTITGAWDGEILLSSDGGTTWNTAVTGKNWSAIATTPDFTHLLACVWDGPLVLSQDAGLTWKTIGPNALWYRVAMSTDGAHLLAAPYQGKLRLSSDSGATWTETIQDDSWSDVAMSADGSVIAAAGSLLWISTDFGASWTQRGGAGPWRAVVVSDDGWSVLAGNSNRLHHSSDRGTSWAPRGPSFDMGRLASSANAQRLVATTANPSRLFVSADGGFTWTPKERDRQWSAVASSADGSFLAATDLAGTIHLSQDDIPELLYEPAANGFGTLYSQFAFRVGDTGVGGSDISTSLNGVTLHVLPVNDAPVVTHPIPDQSATERIAFLFQLPAHTITDPDPGTVVAYEASLADGAPLPSWLAFAPATRTFSGTPGSLDTGTLEIMVTGREVLSDGLSASDVFRLVVTNVNDPPSGTSSSLNLPEDGSWEFSAADFGFSDPLDLPPGSFQRVKITTTPETGVLTVDGQPIAAGAYARLAPAAVADVWTPRSISQTWSAITSSADGARLAAIVSNGRIHTSADAGVTWVARELPRNWHAITSSADGQRLAAVVSQGSIYTSHNAGMTWIPRTSLRLWRAITSSADGARLAAIESPGLIHTSTDFGITWSPRATWLNWQSIASSADGMRLAAVAAGSTVFTSDNAGETWVPSETNRNWRAIASSADGLKLAASEQNGRIHTSADGGINWVARESTRDWISIASSADGTRLVAAVRNGRLHHSRDAGATWRESAPTAAWRGVASSADGEWLAAVATGGRIHTSHEEAAQSLVFTPAPNAAGTPYASFAFQVEDNGATTANLDPTPNIITVNVIESNDAPTIDPIPDPPLTPAEAGPQSLTLTGIGAGGEESQSLAITAVSDRPALLPDPVVDYVSPATEAALHYTPAPDAAGIVVITVTVQDTGGTANGGIDRTTRQFTVALTTPFQRWAQKHGLPLDPSAEHGKNFLAFAFGLNPDEAHHAPIVVTHGTIERHGMPALAHDGPFPTPPFSVLYGRRKDSGLEMQVQFSSDLSNWQPSLAPPNPAGEDDVIEAFSMPFPERLDNDRLPQYFRLKIVGP